MWEKTNRLSGRACKRRRGIWHGLSKVIKNFPFYLMLSIIHCQEKLINSTLMKTWAIFYFAAQKPRISICCPDMRRFSPLGCLTDVHHICRYLQYLLSSTLRLIKTPPSRRHIYDDDSNGDSEEEKWSQKVTYTNVLY